MRVRRRPATNGDGLSVRVPAKINLFLAVRGVRPDGYHELTTVMQTVSVFDTVEVRLAGPPGRSHHPAGRRRMGLELHCDTGAVPTDDRNLALRAARRLGEVTSVLAAVEHHPVHPQSGAVDGPRTVVGLRKAIPVAAGMAGGSADAAATLVALNWLWGCDLGDEALREVGAKIGADVPFCVVGGTALASGRGDAVAQVLCRGRFHWVVGVSDQPLSTADVYRAWDVHCAPSEAEPDAVLAALVAGDADALGAALHNELQPAVFALMPELAARRDALLDAGALGAVVSGAGPTLLALARDAEHARELSMAVSDRFAALQVVRSPAGGPEPVSGG